MFYKKAALRIVAALMAALLVLPTAAQGVFAAADKQITVIVEMNEEPLFALDSVDQISDEQQERYSERTQAERDKILSRAEKSVGSLEVKYAYADVFNGAAVTVRESELKQLESVYGVAKVYEPAKIKLATDDIDDEHLEEFNVRAKEMIDLASARKQGYEGEGVLVAIIDGGFQTDHENFRPIDDCGNKLSRDSVINTIQSGALCTKKVTDKAYISSKIPYYYSYALESNNGEPLTTAEPDHGTHVAGIAAGNGPAVEGVAPKAQVAMMQIAFESDEAYISDVVAAINDAVALGADAVNMSFGENWTDAEFEANAPMTRAIENARNAGVFVAVAAGNEGYLYTETDNPHYASDCFPSTAPGATAVGAANSDCFASVSNSTLSFADKEYEIFVAEDGYVSSGDYAIASPFKGGTISADLTLLFKGGQYSGVFVPVVKGGVGYSADRLLDQFDKLYSKGAQAVLMSRSLYDEIEEDLFFHAFFNYIPPVLVLSDADFNAAVSGGSVTVTEGYPDAMAYFSTWGFDRDLENIVDVSAPGTQVYSSVTEGSYDYYGGTSMASPCVCGASALMQESINRSGIKLWGGERVKVIENALKNTAVPYEDENGAFLSPRLQGAGLMNIATALKNTAVLTDALRGGEAEIHLGTALGDKFSFSFKLTNKSKADRKFDLSASFTTDDFDVYEDEDNGETSCYFNPDDRISLTAAVTGLEKPITVQAGGSVIVDVDVALDAAQTAELLETFTNGFYVDGFILAQSDGETLSIPMTGFYGDYYAVPAVTSVGADFMVNDDDSVLIGVGAAATFPLSRAEVTVTDESGAVIWTRTYTDITYDGWYYQEFTNEDEEEPIKDLAEGDYHVTLTVLPASKNAQEQTFETDFYFPGFHDPEVLSWELLPDEDGSQLRVVSARKDLTYASVTGVTFKTFRNSDAVELTLEEETAEGYIYTGYCILDPFNDPASNYDVEFYNVAGRSQLFKAPVSDAKRNFVRVFGDLINDILSAILFPLMVFEYIYYLNTR